MDESKGGKHAPARTPTHIDTANRHVVALGRLGGDHISIRRPPGRLNKQEALVFCAYIVTLAEMLDPQDVTFSQVLRAVQNT